MNDANKAAMAMGSWRKKSMSHRASQTPGKAKGDSCKRVVKNIDKGYFGKRNKSYKDPRYGDYCKLVDSYHTKAKV